MDPCQCIAGPGRERGEKTDKTLSHLTNFGFKLVVSLPLPPRTHQRIPHSARRGEGREGRELESDQCSPGSRGLRGRAWLVRACLACASSSCHTWSPNYVASRGLNTHRGSSGSRLLAVARSFPSKKSTERAPPLIKVCLPSPPYLVNVC